MQCPKAVIFDLDNTLAEAFHPPSPEILARFEKIVPLIPTAIMSAASLERIRKDVLANASPDFDASKLTLFTANGAQCFHLREGTWEPDYKHSFTPADHATIRTALDEAVRETGYADGTVPYGEQFVDYDGYIAFTALGLGAPSEARKAWDPSGYKRMRLREVLIEKLPQFDVYIGGATSVDITLRGINKAFGVTEFAKQLSLLPDEMLYVGDALYEGGNDAVVIPTGVQIRSVASPEETATVIDEILSACTVK